VDSQKIRIFARNYKNRHMEITGKIIQAFPEQSGTSARGNQWKKREYVLETIETYPKKIFFDFFGDRADQYPLTVGQEIKLYFDINSREYNGRWFVSVSGWKAEPANASAPAAAPAADPFATAPGAVPPPPAVGSNPFAQAPGSIPPPPAADPTDDLPF